LQHQRDLERRPLVAACSTRAGSNSILGAIEHRFLRRRCAAAMLLVERPIGQPRRQTARWPIHDQGRETSIRVDPIVIVLLGCFGNAAIAVQLPA
jgi:hypothetical protein